MGAVGADRAGKAGAYPGQVVSAIIPACRVGGRMWIVLSSCGAGGRGGYGRVGTSPPGGRGVRAKCNNELTTRRLRFLVPCPLVSGHLSANLGDHPDRAPGHGPCPLTLRPLELLGHVGGTSLSLPSTSFQLRRAIDHVVEQGGREGGREAHRGVAYTGNRGVPGPKEAEGTASLFGVGAAQGGEARQGPGQGELPASLTASLNGSL